MSPKPHKQSWLATMIPILLTAMSIDDNDNDKFWALGVADQNSEILNATLTVQGTLPAWLRGTYVLGGPSLFGVGTRKLKHLFDGFARVSTFEFGGCDVHFSSRMLDSEWYNASMAAGDVTADFLMNATSPKRVSDRLPGLNAAAPNDNNIVMPVRMNATTHWYLSDSETRIQFDPVSLRVTRELHSSRPLQPPDYQGDAEPAGYMCTIGTAHSLFHTTSGDLISQMGCSPENPLSAKKDVVVVYRMKRDDPTRRIRIAQFTPSSGVASYMHSFGLTDDFAVLVEQAISFDMRAMVDGSSMIDGMPVNYSQPCYFHLVNLASGDVVTRRSPFSFTFNHVANTVRVGDTIQLDVFEVFRDAHLMVGGAFDIWLNKMRRDSEINFEAIRFAIPLADGANVTARGLLGRDVTLACTRSQCDQLRLPRINPGYQGQSYCFVYAMQTKWGGGPFASQNVVKVDVCRQEVHALGEFHKAGQYPHELLFVPSPSNDTAEDNGLLVGHLLDGPASASFLQVVDARTLRQIANASLPFRLGEMIHGNWFD